MASLHVIFHWVVFLITVESAFSARIAGLSVLGEGSHYLVVRHALVELALRGHEVVIVVPSDIQLKPDDKIPHKVYKVPNFKPGYSEEILVKPALEHNLAWVVWNVISFQNKICDCLLNDTKLLEELRGYDIIVHETVALCPVLVGALLGIPRIAIAPGSPNSPAVTLYKIPLPLAYVPLQVTGFTDKMTFVQRLVNLGVYVTAMLSQEFMFSSSMNPLMAKYNIQAGKGFTEAFHDVELVIFLAHFALEYPQPLPPAVVMVGPLNVRAPKPLPPDLEEFISSSGGDGFVVVSFGSYLTKLLPKEKIDLFASAFGQLKEKVIWKLKGYAPPDLSTNIKTVDWLPQNDLLGHKSIKAFVSHVGQNSLYESAYHGVPVVAVPFFADQFVNAKKVENFGIGLAVNHETVNATQLAETIQKVIHGPRFQEATSRVSRLMKDRRRTPVQETADWIEYVIRHGGASHLRPQVFNISWYQYYLLDIMAFLVAMVTMVVIAIRLIFKCLCHVCCQRSRDNKAKKE